MRFMTYQSLTGAEIAFNTSAVSSPTEIGILDTKLIILWSEIIYVNAFNIVRMPNTHGGVFV